MRISYSSLEVFENCPKRFEFQVIEKIKTPKTKEQVFGTSLHTTLKRFYSKSPVFPTLDELIDYFRLEWQQVADKVKWPDVKSKEAYFNEGKRILEAFYKKNTGQFPMIVALESGFEAPIEDPGKETIHILTGIIDRIDKVADDKFEIIDYKTNRKMPPASMLKDNLQLSIYLLGFLKRWPNMAEPERVDLSLYFLKHGEKLSTKRTKEDAEKIKARVLKNIAEIEKNYFPPIPSALCNYCSFRSICPMWSHLYQEPTPEDAEVKKMVDEYFNLKNEADQTDEKLAGIKRQVNTYLEKKGIERVFGEEGFIGRSVQTKQDYDPEKIRHILENHGFWQQVLSLDKKKFDSLLKKLPPELLKQVEEAKTKTKTMKILKAVKKSLEKIKKDWEN